MNIRIVTDSTCDLPEEIVRQQSITVIPLYINVNEKSYLDGVDLTRDEFYARLPGYFPAPKLLLQASKPLFKPTSALLMKARSPFYPFTCRKH